MTNNTVPFLDLPLQHRALKEELMAEFSAIVDGAGFIGGKHVDAFEAGFAKFTGTKQCVGVANGTDALVLALRALGIGPGDKVIVPAFTFIATAEAVSLVGATPVFADVDAKTYTLCRESLTKVDLTDVKAIMPVHLYGQAADMDAILDFAKSHGLEVIEDAAQAHGAMYAGKPVGSLARVAGFSFYPGKNLGAMGDAGALVSDDVELLQVARRLSNHGRKTQTEHSDIGQNSRLDAIQAMALAIKLRHIADWNAGRARVAGYYQEALGALGDLGMNMQLPSIGDNRTHVFHVYALMVDDRAGLGAYLSDKGVQNGVHYSAPVHLQGAYAHLGYKEGSLPVSEDLARRCLSLPIFPEMTENQAGRVADTIEGFAKGQRS